jgi:hypothetical protein
MGYGPGIRRGAPIALSGTQHRLSLVDRRFVAFLGLVPGYYDTYRTEVGEGEERGRSPHLLADAHPVYGSGEKISRL